MENVTANPLNLIMIMALMGLLPFMVTLKIGRAHV